MQLNTSVREALRWGTAQLKRARVDSPSFDAEVLFMHSTIRANGRMERSWLYAHLSEHLNIETFKHFKRLIRRRERREPVAYILGHKEFYGLDFFVNKNVLIPRPETETLVEQALSEIKNGAVVVDVGTGSGAIAVAMAKELGIRNQESGIKLFATEISTKALRVAKQNARRHGVDDRITFLRGNLLQPFFNHLTTFPFNHLIIVANLPYLPTTEWHAAMPEVHKYEPRGALDGGKDGLKYYREMFGQIYKWCHNPSQPPLTLRGGDRSEPPLKVRGGEGELCIMILCEICPEQAVSFKKLVREFFPSAKCKVIKDLSGRNRVMVVKI